MFPKHTYHDIKISPFPHTEIRCESEGADGIEEVQEPIPKESIGYYEISAYSPSESENSGYSCTASGAPLVPGWTAACNDLPFGALIEIDGHIWEVQDRMLFGGCIDLCMGTVEECEDFGRQMKEVNILE